MHPHSSEDDLVDDPAPDVPDYIPDGVTLRAAHESAGTGPSGRIAMWREDPATRKVLLTKNAMFGAGYVASQRWVSFVGVTPWSEEPYGG